MIATDTSAVPDVGAGPATTLSAPSLPQGATAGAGVPGWWHGPDGTQPPATPGAGLAGTGSQAGPAVPAVWGGRPAVPAGWGRTDSEPAQGGTALARTGSGLGVRVDPGPARPARPGGPAAGGRPSLGGPGQGGPGLGQDGQGLRRRRSLRRAVWDWFAAPLHESPDPIPAWLANLLLRWWPAQAGQEGEATGTDSTGRSGAWAGTAVAVRGGGAPMTGLVMGLPVGGLVAGTAGGPQASGGAVGVLLIVALLVWAGSGSTGGRRHSSHGGRHGGRGHGGGRRGGHGRRGGRRGGGAR